MFFLLTGMMFGLGPNLTGQGPTPPTAQLEAMKKLDWLVGQWKGESWTEFVPGQRRTSSGIETVQSKLGGLLLVIEGLHKSKPPGKEVEVITHQALAVLSYDESEKRYHFRAYEAGGRFVDAEAKAPDGRTLEWGLDTPRGRICYTIKRTESDQWFETGEISSDGKAWQKFFEMTLQRVK